MISARRGLALMALGVLIVASCEPAPASADPIAPQVVNYAYTAAAAMCVALDAYPTLPGVDGVLDGIHDDIGFTWTQAGQALVLGVQYRCPRHLPLLQRYASTVTGAGVSV